MNKLFGKNKERNRSASMQLSINAIVILVMAMAVLGIGLGLIRGVLSSGKDKLTDALEGMDLTEEADSERQITNLKTIKLKRNDDTAIIAGFYNSGYECDSGFELSIDCGDSLVFTNDQSSSVPISIGESGKVGMILKTEGNSGQYMCTGTVFCTDDDNKSESTSAFIEVYS